MKIINKLLIIAFVCFLVIDASAHEMLDDGWHVVVNSNQDNKCNKKYVWAYYQNGIETNRQCALIRMHRGWGEAPENSLESIKMLKEKGYYAYETDIQFTKDNIPVLSHDDTINRVARNQDFSNITSPIYIKDSTLQELNQYIFVVARDGTVLNNYSNNRITTFEEALKYSKENGIYISIELKVGSEEQIKSLVEMVKKYQMINKVEFVSFNLKLLKRVRMVTEEGHLYLMNMAPYSSNCIPDYSVIYCNTLKERQEFHKVLDSKYNTVLMEGDKIEDYQYGSMVGNNFPEDAKEYPPNRYQLPVIKKGTINLKSNTIEIKNTEEKISYTYNGDGVVKCNSSNTNYLTCIIDEDKKEIIINKLKELSKSEIINVYATQGIKYSATSDYQINVNVFLKEDINNDSKVSVIDYILIRKHILKIALLTGTSKEKADVNNDGNISALDYIQIRKKILSLS